MLEGRGRGGLSLAQNDINFPGIVSLFFQVQLGSLKFVFDNSTLQTFSMLTIIKFIGKNKEKAW